MAGGVMSPVAGCSTCDIGCVVSGVGLDRDGEGHGEGDMEEPVFPNVVGVCSPLCRSPLERSLSSLRPIPESPASD